MPLQDTPHTLDTAYQTLLGGPRELVLHPYGGLGPDYHWAFPGGARQFPAILRDAGPIRELTRIVRANPVRGLVAARPNRAEPWDFGRAGDANVFDYVGQLGIPLRPARDFPDDAEGFFLSLHTRSFPDFAAKIAFLRGSSLPVLVTDGLAATLDPAFLERPNVYVIEASVDYPAVVDFGGVRDPYDAHDRLRPVRGARAAWEALADDAGWDLSMKYLGDVRMAARVLGIQLSRTDLDPAFAGGGPAPPPGLLPLADLRAALLAPFGFGLRAPTRVSAHPFGDRYLVLHNFNGWAVTVGLEAYGAAGLELVLTLPATARCSLQPAGTGVRLELQRPQHLRPVAHAVGSTDPLGLLQQAVALPQPLRRQHRRHVVGREPGGVGLRRVVGVVRIHVGDVAQERLVGSRRHLPADEGLRLIGDEHRVVQLGRQRRGIHELPAGSLSQRLDDAPARGGRGLPLRRIGQAGPARPAHGQGGPEVLGVRRLDPFQPRAPLGVLGHHRLVEAQELRVARRRAMHRGLMELAEPRGAVAVVAQHLGVGRQVAGQGEVVADDPVHAGRASGEERRPAGGAHRVGGVTAVEAHAGPRQPVQHRGGRHAAAVAAEAAGRELVGHDEQDVRRPRCGARLPGWGQCCGAWHAWHPAAYRSGRSNSRRGPSSRSSVPNASRNAT